MYPRRLVADMLTARLPDRLAALAVELDAGFDPPPPACYRLVDALPDDDTNPRVLVSSAVATKRRAMAADPHAERDYAYALTVIVTCYATRALDPERASVTRDLLLLAVRECLLLHGRLADDARVSQLGEEETGPGETEDRAGRALSVGVLPVVVHVTEAINTTGAGMHGTTTVAAGAATDPALPPT